MCHAKYEKQETTHDGKNRITKPRKNQIHGEKETYKYSRLLETNTNKLAEMK